MTTATAPRVVRLIAPTDGCAADTASLRSSGYVDGPIVSAVLDLTRFNAHDGAAVNAAINHEKGVGYPLRRARREGYVCREFGGTKRNPEVYAVNTSMARRQGRLMAADYAKPLVAAPGDDDAPRPRACPRHYRTMYGCFTKDDVLAAYVSFVVSDDLGIFSRILGHGAHLKDGVVHAVVAHALTAAHGDGVSFVLYGGWGDGLEGLKLFKRHWGFEPVRLRMEGR